jgi:transposase
VLRKWVRELRNGPQEAVPGKGKHSAQCGVIAWPPKNVAQLKMERDILKKAAAYFAEEWI